MNMQNATYHICSVLCFFTGHILQIAPGNKALIHGDQIIPVDALVMDP